MCQGRHTTVFFSSNPCSRPTDCLKRLQNPSLGTLPPQQFVRHPKTQLHLVSARFLTDIAHRKRGKTKSFWGSFPPLNNNIAIRGKEKKAFAFFPLPPTTTLPSRREKKPLGSFPPPFPNKQHPQATPTQFGKAAFPSNHPICARENTTASLSTLQDNKSDDPRKNLSPS